MNNKKERIQKQLLPDLGKIPPQSIELEECVLGTFITNYKLIAKYPYLKPETFYKEQHQIIYKAMLDLYDREIKVDLFILSDYLRTIDKLTAVGGPVYLSQLTNKDVVDPDNHVKIITQKYFYRQLISLANNIQINSFDEFRDPLDIIDDINSTLLEITDFEVETHNNFIISLENTIKDIKASALGENITVIKTGFTELDKRLTFRTRYVCIIAGPEASGKSKFASVLIRGMLDNEPNIAVQWFSFEEERSQLIRGFLSMDLKKTSKELQSINYKMSDEDIQEVEKQSKKYEKYIIEFHDKATSINNIVTRAKRFGDKYQNHKKIVVIDNLGLIECDKTGIDRDDFLAAKIKSIADNNNTAVILIHHFTKEISRKANIDDGYRPRKEHLKGSTRILDYVQQALFVNLPRKYPDLLAEEKNLSLDFIHMQDIEFSEANFDKYLWSINSMPDKETEKIIDLRIETFVKIRSLLNNETKFANGKIITFSDIIQKYKEYVNFIDNRNKGVSEDRFKKMKSSILSFIIRREFNINYVTNEGSSRSLYLYGKNKNLKYHIDNLFIVESVKNRDDDNLSENAIYRFIVDLGYNLFKEIKDDESTK